MFVVQERSLATGRVPVLARCLAFENSRVLIERIKAYSCMTVSLVFSQVMGLLLALTHIYHSEPTGELYPENEEIEHNTH